MPRKSVASGSQMESADRMIWGLPPAAAWWRRVSPLLSIREALVCGRRAKYELAS